MFAKRIILIIVCFLLFSNLIHSQVKTNFQLIDSLVNYSGQSLKPLLNQDVNYSIQFSGADSYSILKSSLIKGLISAGIVTTENSESRKIDYYLDEAIVKYSDVFKDGIIGDYLVVRNAEIRGKYSIDRSNLLGNFEDFEYTVMDTVSYSNISYLENVAYPFTSANLPDEPFFSSLLEPAIAIGTAAVAIYLFFNIRSK